MVVIYCIEDINDLKYVGSTKMILRRRFQSHKDNKTCSSTELNLYNAIIYPLEECSEEDRKIREQHWIDEIDCVNKNNATTFNRDKWEEDNKEKRKEQKAIIWKKWSEKNREKRIEYHRQRRKLKREQLENNNR